MKRLLLSALAAIIMKGCAALPYPVCGSRGPVTPMIPEIIR